MLDSPTIHTHPHPHPHLNGNSVVPPTPGAISNGSAHAMVVSPAAVPIPIPNGPPSAPAPSNTIHKLSVANEQTWLLIGTFDLRLEFEQT